MWLIIGVQLNLTLRRGRGFEKSRNHEEATVEA